MRDREGFTIEVLPVVARERAVAQGLSGGQMERKIRGVDARRDKVRITEVRAAGSLSQNKVLVIFLCARAIDGNPPEGLENRIEFKTEHAMAFVNHMGLHAIGGGFGCPARYALVKLVDLVG